MIKLFNQFINELKTSTYIKTGEELKKYKHTDRGNKLIDYGNKKALEEVDGYIEYVDIKDGTIHSVNLKNITVKIKNDNNRYLYIKDGDFLILKLDNKYSKYNVKITKLFDRKSAIKLRNFLYKNYIYDLENKIRLNDLYRVNFKISEELNLSTYQKAGEILKSKGHEERGNKLIKYGMDKFPSNEISYYDKGGNVKTISIKDLIVKQSYSKYEIIDSNNNTIIVTFDTIPHLKYKTFSRLTDRKSAIVLWKFLNKYGIFYNNKPITINVNRLYNQEDVNH